MIRASLVALVALVLLCCARGERRGAAVTKVVGTADRWWLVDDTGGLRSYDGRRMRRELKEEHVLDIARTPRGMLLALARARRGGPVRVLSHVDRDAWLTFAALTGTEADTVLGFAASDTDVVMVTTHALVRATASGRLTRTPIAGNFVTPGLLPSVARAGGKVYAASDMGEFGGRLVEIDAATGDATARTEGGPATAVVQDPTYQGCVVVAYGLRHMIEEGQLLRICGHDISPLAAIPCENAPKEIAKECTTAIFGLARDRDGFWAASGPALRHFHADTIDRTVRMPKLKTVDGIELGEPLPGVLVLWTDVNWQASLSGPTPLVATRP